MEEPLFFNRYDLTAALELTNMNKINVLMAAANSYTKKVILKTMTVATPNNRRGTSSIISVRHYELNAIIEHFENKIKRPDARFMASWKRSLKSFKIVKEYLCS